jgi:hypothetical protein
VAASLPLLFRLSAAGATGSEATLPAVLPSVPSVPFDCLPLLLGGGLRLLPVVVLVTAMASNCQLCKTYQNKARRGWRSYYALKEKHLQMMSSLRREMDELRRTSKELPKHVTDKLAELSEKLGDSCPICLDKLKRINFCLLQPCFHAFCSTCTGALFRFDNGQRRRLACPVCRQDVTEDDVVHFV